MNIWLQIKDRKLEYVDNEQIDVWIMNKWKSDK